MSAVQAAPVAVPEHRRQGPKRRHLWLIPGLAVGIYASTLASHHDLGLLPLLVFGIVPHLSVVVGIGQPHVLGQLAPRAAQSSGRTTAKPRNPCRLRHRPVRLAVALSIL